MTPRTHAGQRGLDALLAAPEQALMAFDYDGTLAPIVQDPATARPHPRTAEVLAEVAGRGAAVAIITGRPARQAVELARLDRAHGLDRLVVLGHYGMERWDAATGEIVTQPPPAGLEQVRASLPDLLVSLGAADAAVEDKGLSVAVHVRRLPDPAAAYERVVGPLSELAEHNDLVAEPGRFVVELRPPGMDKGQALRLLVRETGAVTVTFAGDDLGDLAAFAEVERLRGDGTSGLLVCSGSTEVTALAERADLVVDGPDGVLEWLDGVLDGMGRRG